MDDLARIVRVRPQLAHDPGIVAVRHEADVLAVRLHRYAEAQLRRDGAHRRLLHAAQREAQIIELRLRGGEEEVALVPRRIDRAVQLRALRAHHPPHIMARGEAVRAQIPRQREQVREFHAHIAAYARDRRAPRQIFVGEALHDRVTEAALIVEHIMRDAELVGDRARIANILPSAAAARPAHGRAMIVELQRHADRLGARARGQCSHHARIDTTGHGDDDAPPAQIIPKLKEVVHRRHIGARKPHGQQNGQSRACGN